MARYMADLLPSVPMLVSYVPTSPSRIRARSFDQAAYLAKQLAARKKLYYCPLLIRHKNVHQVGSTRSQRRRQIKGAFRVINMRMARGKSILLVDDVMTTGASLEESARVLKAAGATDIYAVVFAR